MLSKCKKISCLIIFTLCMLFPVSFVFASDGNLLTNPDWETGLDGWVIQAKNAAASLNGETINYSSIYQDVPLTEPAGGQKLALSAMLKAEPQQEYIEMELILCKADGSHISHLTESEPGAEWTYHEIITAVPSDAVYARVLLTIWKHDDSGTFGFDNLNLAEIQTAVNMQPQDGSFVKTDSQSPSASDPETIDYGHFADMLSGNFRNAGFILGDGSLWTVGDYFLGGGAEHLYTGESVWVTDNADAVSLGDNNGAVIKKDGTLWTWGSKANDLLGFESSESALTPVYLMDDIVKVSMGNNHAAAVKSDGSLWMWGSNANGQLGFEIFIDNKGVKSLSEPTYLMDNVADVSCSIYNYGGFTLVLKKDGTLWTFGDDSCGELGEGTLDLSQQVVYTFSDGGKGYDRPRRSEPRQIMENVICISTGQDNAAAVQADGSLWTWGRNDKGQAGNGGIYNTISDADDGIECQTLPVKILDDAVSVSLGVDHGAALKSDGSVWCWGNNWGGQLGIGVSPASGTGGEAVYTTPQKADIQDVIAIAAGDQFTVAVKSDGTVWGWGGIPHVFNSPEPVQILEDLPGMSINDYAGLNGIG